MKPILLLLCTAFLLSCNQTPKAETSKDPSLKGTWKMISYLNYSGDGSVDTIMTSEKFIQMKMFSETKFMWNRFTTYDSTEWFGSGDYTFKNDTLAEHTEYGSEALLSVLEQDSIHRLDIVFINEDSYMQTEKDSLGNPIYGEIYHRIK